MARVEEVTVTLIDDFDGSEAAESVQFGLDGKNYEIDLSRANAAEFRRTLKPYVDRARVLRGSPRRRGTSSPRGRTRAPRSGASYDAQKIREWAKANRIKVSPRGRIPADVVERWRTATSA
jgi:hypothetical protein